MDFRKLAKALPAADDAANGTETLTLTDLPSNILEALIPGYSLISKAIMSSLGIDISVFVSIGLILFAVTRGGQYLFEQLERAFRSTFMSSVHIDEEDDLFDMVMSWLAVNQGPTSRRSVRAKTQRGSSVEADGGVPSDALDEHGVFDYNKWQARTPPRFEPYYGRNIIWHNGRLFFFRRSQKPSTQRMQITYSGGDDDMLQLDCIGRSTEPIRELLRFIKISELNNLRGTTTIRHPTPKEFRGRFSGAWSKTITRPIRPMETVIVDVEQKSMIIRDMNEFLHPSAPKWYATRGIPYRRGYLLHGPPGTGKTSLSFALAGIFGLEIYAISLQEPTLTEGDLMQLFNALPRRCIVLLEDVDAAGLLRDGKSDEGKTGKKGKDKKKGDEKEDKKEEPKKEEEITLKDVVRELKKASGGSGGSGGRGGNANNANNTGGHPNRAPGTGISLSGLLNAIDGVATHEGRVLIMTTNHPEKLDAALIRPGRVDRKVGFSLAKYEQIRELFVRMYAAGDELPDIEPHLGGILSSGSSKAAPNGKPVSKKTPAVKTEKVSVGPSQAELEEMAVEFAGIVPDDSFTPAEIQNLLMMYKKEPRTAVERAASWAKELTEEKAKAAKERAEAEEDDE